MASPSGVRLLEVEPDIGRFLTAAEQKAALSELIVPTLAIDRDTPDVMALIESAGAFGGLLLEGVLAQELQLGDQLTILLLGPGDALWLSGGPLPVVLSSVRCTVPVPTRMALLGSELLIAARRWPRIVSGLQLRLAQQNDRLAAQLAICQLPRVDQRVLALMWLLAESWGRVTQAGTRVPLGLTHDVLGALVGARRPTVTLAMRELTERGAIIRQDHGWLLLEAPPTASTSMELLSSPVLVEDDDSTWSVSEEHQDRRNAQAELEASFNALRDTVSTMRERHRRDADRFKEQLGRLTSSRERCAESRREVARQRLSRERSPSS
jgi:hypothetical protein